MSVTIYTKENCVQCRATTRAMDKAGISYELKSATEPDNLTYLKDDLAVTAAPVVVADGADAEDGELSYWYGFRPELVKELAARQDTAPAADVSPVRSTTDPEVGTREWFLDQMSLNRDQAHTDYSGLTAPMSEWMPDAVAGTNSVAGRDFTNATFEGAVLRGLDFERCSLTDVNFTRADLSRVQFWQSDVAGADFTDADCTGADFTSSTGFESVESITNATFDRANMTGMRLHKQALGTASFKGALLGLSEINDVLAPDVDFSDADFTRAHINRGELDGINITNAIAPALSVSNSSLVGSNAFEADFQGAVFTGVDARDTVFSSSSLQGAAFRSCNLEETAYRHANASGAVFDHCHLAGAEASLARFDGAQLTSCQLREADFSHTSARAASFQGSELQSVNFTHSDVRGADFRNTDLSRADFTGAVTTGADFTGATLDGVVGLAPTTSATAPTSVLRGVFAHTLPESLAAMNGSQGDLQQLTGRVVRQDSATVNQKPTGPDSDSGVSL